jgi:hypothetical protein
MEAAVALDRRRVREAVMLVAVLFGFWACACWARSQDG